MSTGGPSSLAKSQARRPVLSLSKVKAFCFGHGCCGDREEGHLVTESLTSQWDNVAQPQSDGCWNIVADQEGVGVLTSEANNPMRIGPYAGSTAHPFSSDEDGWPTHHKDRRNSWEEPEGSEDFRPLSQRFADEAVAKVNDVEDQPVNNEDPAQAATRQFLLGNIQAARANMKVIITRALGDAPFVSLIEEFETSITKETRSHGC